MEKAFEILEEYSEYQGFFNLSSYKLRHTLFEGGWTESIRRELFHRGHCVGVIPYDPVLDQVVLIEQFRIGAIRDKAIPWLTEIVAGAVEPGESAEEVAYRESMEEAGCEIKELLKIGEFYTSPGGTSEKITLFCGLIDSSEVGGIHGLKEEHEDIRALVVDFEAAFAWIESGVVDSAIPIVGLQWLALNRSRLRGYPKNFLSSLLR